MRDYTKIKAWQLADDLTVDIYGSSAESVGGFPFFLSMVDRRSGWIKRNQVRVSLRVRSSVGLSVMFSLVPRSRRRSR